MTLVQVDIIRLQAAQASFHFRQDMPARQADVVRGNGLAKKDIRVEADFGREDHRLTAILDDAAGNFFGSAGCIDVGGIEKVAAEVDKAIDNFPRGSLVGLASERHATEA